MVEPVIRETPIGPLGVVVQDDRAHLQRPEAARFLCVRPVLKRARPATMVQPTPLPCEACEGVLAAIVEERAGRTPGDPDRLVP